MPHVSKRRLDKKTEDKLLDSLQTVLGNLSKEDGKEFMFSLLSETERLMLAKRLGIIVLLKEKVPESQIAIALHVTRETVARMHNYLALKEKGYNIALKKLAREKASEEFKAFLLELVKYAARAAGGRVKPGIIQI